MNILKPPESEKSLLAHIDILRQSTASWYGILIRPSALKCPLDRRTFNALSSLLKRDAWKEGMGALLRNNDVALLLPPVEINECMSLITEISALFPELSPAQSVIDDRGNALCRFYQSDDEREEFEGRLLLARHPRQQEESYLPDPVAFAHSRAQRRMRKMPSILVAEDQRFSRQLVASIIDRRYEVLTAQNGVEAMRLYEEFAPNIVLLDIDLPGMDGHTLLNIITNLDEDAFVIMLTASQLEYDVQTAISHKARGYIVKPFTKQKLQQYLNLYQQYVPAASNKKVGQV